MPMSVALFPWDLYATPTYDGMYHIVSQRKMALREERVLLQVAAWGSMGIFHLGSQ